MSVKKRDAGARLAPAPPPTQSSRSLGGQNAEGQSYAEWLASADETAADAPLFNENTHEQIIVTAALAGPENFAAAMAGATANAFDPSGFTCRGCEEELPWSFSRDPKRHSRTCLVCHEEDSEPIASKGGSRKRDSESVLSAAAPSWDFQSGDLPFERHLYGYAVKKTRNEQDAKDLVQETYRKAFSEYDGFTEGTNLRAWLFAILKNAMKDRVRRAMVRPVETILRENDMGDDDDTAEAQEAQYIPTAEKKSEKTPNAAPVTGGVEVKALAALSEKLRLVAECVYLQDLSYEETADALGIPVAIVKSRLHSARRVLEKSVSAYRRPSIHHLGADKPFPTRLEAARKIVDTALPDYDDVPIGQARKEKRGTKWRT